MSLDWKEDKDSIQIPFGTEAGEIICQRVNYAFVRVLACICASMCSTLYIALKVALMLFLFTVMF